MRELLDFSTPHLLRDEAEYEAALAEVEALMVRDPAPGTPEAERLDFLVLMVEAYEEAHYPMPPRSSPQDVVSFLLEQRGMTRAELVPHLGGRSRVSEFFSGARELSTGQIQALRALFDVSADLLLPLPTRDLVARAAGVREPKPAGSAYPMTKRSAASRPRGAKAAPAKGAAKKSGTSRQKPSAKSTSSRDPKGRSRG